jgi:hypothetical protein
VSNCWRLVYFHGYVLRSDKTRIYENGYGGPYLYVSVYKRKRAAFYVVTKAKPNTHGGKFPSMDYKFAQMVFILARLVLGVRQLK